MSTKQTFTFTYEGKEYTIPSIKSVPNGVIRQTRKIEDELDKTYTIIELLLGEDSEELAVLDKMTLSEFIDFSNAWTQGASVGESTGSES